MGLVRDRLIGAWRLVDWKLQSAEGFIDPPMGPTSELGGLLIYSPDGFMSATLSRRNRAHFRAQSAGDGEAADKVAAYETFTSYAGKFRVDETTSEVFHSVLYSSFPNNVGRELRRVCIFEGDDKVKLDTPPMVFNGTSMASYILWQRAEKMRGGSLSEMIKMGGVPVDGSVRKFRRIVTGHNSNGESVILSDDLCPHSRAIMGVPTFAGTLLWVTKETPVDNSTDPGDPAAEEIGVAPPLTGSILRVVEFAPDVTWQSKHNLKVMMHRTASLDYAIVLQGEIFAVLDKSETLMKPGDVLIQRGTNHAWANCSNAPSIVLFVLIGAEAISGLSSQV